MNGRVLTRRGFLAVTGIVIARPLRAAVKSDETVLFYPAHAVLDGDHWQFDLRTRIFERERRPVTMALLAPIRQAVGLNGLSDAEERLFRDRARLFVADNERGKRLNIQIGPRLIALTRSGEDGFSITRIRVAAREALKAPAAGMPEGWLSLRAVLSQRDQRGFTGTVRLVEPHGITVISDIDDTIKVTNVLDRGEMIRNTFARPFAAVPGMAARYAAWLKSAPGTALHYVSSSPWQLFEPLEAFRQSADFPPGTFHLRELRVAQLKSFATPEAGRAHKLAEIAGLIRAYPERRFWLIGDSGEQDPEVYGEIARRFPVQAARIFIRELAEKPVDSVRRQAAFDAVPEAIYTIFREPDELPATLVA